MLLRQTLRLTEREGSFKYSCTLLCQIVLVATVLSCAPSGSVAEWLNAPVLKTGVLKSIVSSNLTGPAKELHRPHWGRFAFWLF